MKIGTSHCDITPRVGVEMAGFGPFLNRHSIGVRSPLMAKALALEVNGDRLLVINCELCGLVEEFCDRVAAGIRERLPELAPERILICCTHTHSGPTTYSSIGWGEKDPVYTELLPGQLIELGIRAWERLEPVEMSYGKAPCEHIGLNREREQDAPPLEVALDPEWRSKAPGFTDTEVQVLKFTRPDGSVAAFTAYFGCHPVVCCQLSRYFHGDFPALALATLEQEFPGAAGIFLQGAQGDVNSCVVHKPEAESLRALDVIAARFAVSVRAALAAAEPVAVPGIAAVRRRVEFTPRRTYRPEELDAMIAGQRAKLHAPGARETDWATGMAMVTVLALERMRAKLAADPNYRTRVFLGGVRLGTVELLTTPLEIMQMIKNEVTAAAAAEHPMVLGLCHGCRGYAPDREIVARDLASGDGYTTDVVPLILGELPYLDIHSELAAALLEIDAELNR